MADTKFVYVIDCNTLNRVKIGISGNAISRMAQIQASSPIKVKLTLVFLRLLLRADAMECERVLHAHFAPFRLHGEWFSIDPQEAAELTAGMVSGYPPPAPAPIERQPDSYYVKGSISLARKATL